MEFHSYFFPNKINVEKVSKYKELCKAFGNSECFW